MKEMKSKKNRVKRLVGVICLLVMFIIGNVHPTYIFTQVNESEIETEAIKETASKDNKEERESREKEEEKKFLKEKLEIISEEITEDYLKWHRICNDIKMNISIHEIQKRYFYRKEYKKAFLLVQMYFPSLEKPINSYDFESRLEIYMNYTPKDISSKIAGNSSNEEKIKILEKEILDQCKEKSEKYNYFMKCTKW